MTLSRWLRKWWLGRQQHIESILSALLAAREWGIGKALASLSRTVRHRRAIIPHRRFIPLLEELEPRIVFNVPVITGVTPDVGPVTGGAAVTITGSGFTGATAVSFGNGHPAGFLVLSDTTLKVTSPAESPGLVDILVTNADGQSSPTTADQYTYTNQPSITAVSPNQGSTDGGNTVIITGLNLNTATTVLFGDKPATSFTDSKNQITAIAPAHAAGLVDVQVVTANGITPTSAADEYTYAVPAPVITGISPNSGSTHGGQQITITGTDLTGATQVSFGDTPAVSFNVVSATQILATAPPGSAGIVDVTVTTAGGTSATATADEFTYTVPAPVVTGVNPGSGTTDGGTPVVISGTDLSGATQVLFGTTAATAFTVVTPSEIMATTPAGTAGAVDVTVITAGGTSATSTADQFTYKVPAPVITGLSPSSGSTDGGEQVLITGTDLAGATAVTFGTVAATSFQQVSNTEIAAIAPAGTAGTVDVRVTTAGGTSAIKMADQYLYVAPTPTTTSIPNPRPTITGVSTSGDSIIITGANFTGATKLQFGENAATSFTVDSDTQITVVEPSLAPGTHVSVMVQTPAGKSAPSTAASYVVTSNDSGDSGSGSGSGGGIFTPAALPSRNPAGSPMLSAPFAPHLVSTPFVPRSDGSGGGDGTGGATPTTAVSSTSWNTPTSSYNSASGSGHDSYSDSWGYHYQMTVTADSKVIYSYTANGGGHSSSSSSWSNDSGSWSASSNSWSNDHWFSNIVSTISSGTQGGNFSTTTTTNKSSGKDKTSSNYSGSGSWSPSSFSESGSSDATGTGTSTRSNTSNGHSSYTMPGGNGTGHWNANTTAHYGYANNQNSTLGSDGIWLSSGSMSNHGSGTSYSSLSGKFGYALTSSPPGGSGSEAGGGHSHSTEHGGWSNHDKDTYGTAGGSYTGGQTSHSNGTSTSTSQTHGNSSHTIPGGKATSHWKFNYTGGGSNNYSGGGNLGSDGIWITSGSMSVQRMGAGHSSSKFNASFALQGAVGSSSYTGAGTSMSSGTSGSSSSSLAASTMRNGVWTPVTGKQSDSEHVLSKYSSTASGNEKSVVVGDKLSGAWSISNSNSSKYAMIQKSALGTGGKWTTTGAATEAGITNGKALAGETGTESLKSSSSGKGIGSLTIKESGNGHYTGSYRAEQTLTQGGGWVSASGTATSTSGCMSSSSDNGGGAFNSATAGGGSSHGNWSEKIGENSSFSSQVNAKVGSGGIWITQGSVSIKGSGSGSNSYSDKGKYQISADGGGSGSFSNGSSGWDSGSETSTSSGGSNSSNTFNANYSLGADGNWDPVSGSAVAKITASAKDSLTSNGDFGSTLPGGSCIGTWNMSGNEQSSNMVLVNSTLGSNGGWKSTGTDKGSDVENWSAGFQGSGRFSISTGTVGSGNWDDESGTVTESGSNMGGYSDNYQFSLDTNGNWQAAGGSASANDTATENVSVGVIDNYGVANDSDELTGSRVENNSLGITANANNNWTLGTGGGWAPSTSSSGGTETINNTLTDTFSEGGALSGSDQSSLQEVLTSSNGSTPAVTTFAETVTGSFNVNGTQASFTVNIGGLPSAPTISITETNTTALNGLSVNTDNIESLDGGIIAAVAGNSPQGLVYLPGQNSSSFQVVLAGASSITLNPGNAALAADIFKQLGMGAAVAGGAAIDRINPAPPVSVVPAYPIAPPITNAPPRPAPPPITKAPPIRPPIELPPQVVNAIIAGTIAGFNLGWNQLGPGLNGIVGSIIGGVFGGIAVYNSADAARAQQLQSAINRLRAMKAEAQKEGALARVDELAREIQRLLDEIDKIFGIGQ